MYSHQERGCPQKDEPGTPKWVVSYQRTHHSQFATEDSCFRGETGSGKARGGWEGGCGHVAMGQNPVPPVNIPIPTKID